MQQYIKKLFKANKFFIAIFITVLVGYLSLMKMPKMPSTFNGIDKWQHSIAYFTLSISWLLSFYKKPKKKYIIILLCIFYGIIIEVLQDKLTNYRTADYFDILANSIGVLLGLLVFNQIMKKNQLINNKTCL